MCQPIANRSVCTVRIPQPTLGLCVHNTGPAYTYLWSGAGDMCVENLLLFKFLNRQSKYAEDKLLTPKCFLHMHPVLYSPPSFFPSLLSSPPPSFPAACSSLVGSLRDCVPSALIVTSCMTPPQAYWIRYAQTEVIEVHTVIVHLLIEWTRPLFRQISSSRECICAVVM